jgi:NAD(P)-dependent dehydrogenase (short-subunit alcohol dehydrogenase family)
VANGYRESSPSRTYSSPDAARRASTRQSRRSADNVTGMRSDITKQVDLDVLAAAIKAHGTGLDVVFANAGGGEFARLGEIMPEHLSDTFNRNVGGTVFTVQTMLPLLNPGASIVLSGSTSASNGRPAFAAYAVSKAAIRSLGRTFASELVYREIRVNTIVPGPVKPAAFRSWRPPTSSRRCSTTRPPRCR